MLARTDDNKQAYLTYLQSLTPAELLAIIHELEDTLDRDELAKLIKHVMSAWVDTIIMNTEFNKLDLLTAPINPKQSSIYKSLNKREAIIPQYPKYDYYQGSKFTNSFYTNLPKPIDYINKPKISDLYNYKTINPNPSSIPESTDPDMRAVARLLADRITMARLFMKLESEFAEYSKAFLGNQMRIFANKKPHHKLFTSFCQQWARKKGFSDFIKLKDGISPEEFAGKLIQLQLFDDIAFRGTAHGAVGHFMQWVAIVYYYEETKFLSKSPTELYASIGYQLVKAPSVDNWFNAFEIARTSNVFALNNYLLSNSFRLICPHLNAMIQSRELKDLKAPTL